MTASKTDNASYQIQIYTDLTDPKDPASGVPAYAPPFEYTQALAGIDTVTLPEPVMLTPGSQFSVILTLADSQISYYVEASRDLDWLGNCCRNYSRTEFLFQRFQDLEGCRNPGQPLLLLH